MGRRRRAIRGRVRLNLSGEASARSGVDRHWLDCGTVIGGVMDRFLHPHDFLGMVESSEWLSFLDRRTLKNILPCEWLIWVWLGE